MRILLSPAHVAYEHTPMRAYKLVFHASISPYSIYFKKCIYLAVSGLSCGIRDFYLQHVGPRSPTKDQTGPSALGVRSLSP